MSISLLKYGKGILNSDEIKEYIKTFKTKYKKNQILDSDDFDLMISLLEYTDQYPNIDVTQINAISILMGGSVRGGIGFKAHTFNRKKYFFKSSTCLKPAKSNRQKFMYACRNAIQNQLWEFKQINRFENYYIHSDGRLISPKVVSVDHILPFRTIVDNFIKSAKIDINSIKYCEKLCGIVFKDDILMKEFQKYHKNNASLQILTTTENTLKG